MTGSSLTWTPSRSRRPPASRWILRRMIRAGAGGLLTSLERVPDLPSVDIRRFPRVQVWLEGVRLLKRHFGDEVYVRGNCDQCPFTLASLLRGMDDWMMDLMDPEKEESVESAP